ncbi:MAG: hypothetical protein FJ118_14525 [Deltaproteobacteria bacterium]|nr:hypothetical protein [Deltaproteobacteria bacterium]
MRRRNWMVLIYLFVCFLVPRHVFTQTSNMEPLVPKETPDGWIARGAPQTFTKETLFEHINGQADLFLQYGFEGSIFAVYGNNKSSQEKIDLDIYDMGAVVQAFGVFSRFRQDDRPGGIGLDSYLDDRYAFFYKGKYFVALQATESSSDGIKQIARTVESRIVDSSPPPKEIGYFPKRGLKPGSIEYYPQGLMGRQFLKRGFKATYVKPDKTEAAAEGPDSNLFIAVFPNPEEAESAFRSFKEVLIKKGSAHAPLSPQTGFEPARGEDAYQGKLIIAHKGPYLIGAAGFEKEKDAESLLAELSASIK